MGLGYSERTCDNSRVKFSSGNMIFTMIDNGGKSMVLLTKRYHGIS